MLEVNATGTIVMISPQQAAFGAPVEGVIERYEGNHLNVLIVLGPQSDPANNPSVLKLQEADIDSPGEYVDIPEFVGDGPDGFVIPPADTVNHQVINLGVTLVGRKKYFKLIIQPEVEAQDLCAVGMLSRASDMTAITERNTLLVEG